MLTATCHCEAVRVEVSRKPRSLTNFAIVPFIVATVRFGRITKPQRFA